MYIGRDAEQSFLEEKYHARGGQLIVVYGRRRIGKTETLREFCKGKSHVFYSCRECTDRQQLLAFSEAVLKDGIPAFRYLKEFPDWETAFRSIPDFPGEGKKLLVIDEFPYMCGGNREIPSLLQNLWDLVLKDEDIMVILCGSAMSFMEKEILSEKNPLYGRATGIYKMTELPFADAIRFFPRYSAEEKMQAYAVLGGIPHYLKQFDDRLTVAENIKKAILTKGSVLYSEVEFLLRQELRETAVYNTVISAVALGNTGLNDIFNKTQIEKSKLSVYLKNLMDLQIVEREFSVSDGLKEQANSSRGLYRLTDRFFRFWYAFVFPAYSDLEAGDVKGVYRYAVEPRFHEFTAYVFEDICREYIRMKNRRGELPCRYDKIGRWWGKLYPASRTQSREAEIDVMAIDRQHKNYLLGECKYKASPFDLADYKKLVAKWVGNPDMECRFFGFSQSGFTDAVRMMEREGGFTCVTLEEMVEQFLR